MDDITRAVQAMYQQYPYPSGAPAMRIGTHARLLLSYVEHCRDGSRPIHVLDAGCGRGVGTVGAAALQPDVVFTGIDINTVGLADAAAQASARGLNNVSFQYCDLMTLEGLSVPAGGFDVIFSSGVLHHLSDPAQGLNKLKEALAPHGVISFMVYGSFGRQALTRLIESIDLISPRTDAPAQRLESARTLARLAETHLFKDTYWAGTADADDIEFVDRCLHINERSYDIAALWQLFESAGMRFVRWLEPEQWSVAKLIDDSAIRRLASALGEKEQYQLIERLFPRPTLELLICKDSNHPRLPLAPEEIDRTFFAVNPDVTLLVEKRNLRGSQRIEHLFYTLRGGEQIAVEKGPLAQTLLLLVDQTESFSGVAMISALGHLDIPPELARQVLQELVAREILYCPHFTDV